jgi:hypothetical protein
MGMSMRTEAEEHLRVIRSLMERATIYRAISAPAALIAGVLACVAGFVFVGQGLDVFLWNDAFQAKWLFVLLIASIVNTWFLARDARRRGDPFVSPSMRLALRAMFPALLCGGVFAWVFPSSAAVPFWQMTYGLALLSTKHFAPPSLARLGWPFLISGMAVLLVSVHKLEELAPTAPWDDYLMATTFGIFHVIYAACAWPRKSSEAAPAPVL